MTRSALFVHASSDLYGSDIACLRVVEGAVRAGWEVTVTVPWQGPLVSELEAAGARVIELDPLKLRRAELAWPAVAATPWRWLCNYRQLRRLARRRHFDLVYTTTAPTTGGHFLARRWQVPHVYHVHEIFWHARPLVLGLDRLLRQADVVLCCSLAVADQFSPRVPTRVVHTGADVDAGTLTTVPFSGPHTVITCVARINEWKGQDVLIDAVSLLKPRFPGLHLRLVGDVYRGEVAFRVALEAQVQRLGLQDVVSFEGERRDAHALIGTSDVIVLPSKRPEPFGMVVVEAMLLGRPVIATRAGGPTEILTDGVNGLLVELGDPAALAGAIASLIADPDRARAMAERGRERAQSLTTTMLVAEVIAVFDELVVP